MTYVKAALIGLLAGVAAAVLWAAAVLFTPLFFLMAEIRSTGSGGLGAVSLGLGSVLPAFVLGFVLAFWLSVRRARRRRLRGVGLSH